MSSPWKNLFLIFSVIDNINDFNKKTASEFSEKRRIDFETVFKLPNLDQHRATPKLPLIMLFNIYEQCKEVNVSSSCGS